METKEVKKTISQLEIRSYLDELKQVCKSCVKSDKCKKHQSLCLRKRFVWAIAKKEYARRLRKEGTNERC